MFSRSVMPGSLRPHVLQHTRLPCPSPSPGACSKSCPSSQWCHATISSSVVLFSSCLQSFPASWSFPMSQFFISGGQVLEFNMPSRFVITFLPRTKCLLISWLQSPSAVILEPLQNKASHCFHCFPIYLPWSDGTGCHDLSFLNVEF